MNRFGMYVLILTLGFAIYFAITVMPEHLAMHQPSVILADGSTGAGTTGGPGGSGGGIGGGS